MFEDIELNPKAALMAVLGAMISLYVMKNVEVGIIFKILSFVGTLIVCYFMVEFISNK